MKLLLSLGFVIIMISCQPADKKENSGESRINTAIELTSLNGQAINLSAYKEKFIFINFWATWCGPCIKEMPGLEKLQQALKDEPVIFFYASNDSPKRVKNFKKHEGFDLNFVHLKSSLESLNIYALPTTYLINGKGEIIFQETGQRDWDSNESITELKNLINENV